MPRNYNYRIRVYNPDTRRSNHNFTEYVRLVETDYFRNDFMRQQVYVLVDEFSDMSLHPRFLSLQNVEEMSVTHIRSMLNDLEDNANNNLEAAHLSEGEVEMELDPEIINEDDHEELVVEKNVPNNVNESNVLENNEETNSGNINREVIDPTNDVMELDPEVVNKDDYEELFVEKNVPNNVNESNVLENNEETNSGNINGEVMDPPNENEIEVENSLLMNDDSMRENNDRSSEENNNGNVVESIESVEENNVENNGATTISLPEAVVCTICQENIAGDHVMLNGSHDV